MPRLQKLAKWMLVLGLALTGYWFYVAYLWLEARVEVPEIFLAAWRPAGYAGPGLAVLGLVLVLRPRLVENAKDNGPGAALIFLTPILLLAAYLVANSLFFTWFGTHTDGRIVALEPGGRGSVTPVLQYQAAGRTHTIRPIHERTSRDEPAYNIGDSLPVLYRPDNPPTAVVGTFQEVWGLPLFAGGAATLVLFVLILSCRPARPRNPVVFQCRFFYFEQTSNADGS